MNRWNNFFQVTMVTSEGVPVAGVVSEDQAMSALQLTQQAAQAAIQQLQQGQGIQLTGDGEQQILVVTDPAQLEALQVGAHNSSIGHFILVSGISIGYVCKQLSH